MANRRVVINLHSSANTAPQSSEVNFGELVVSHNDKGNASIYTKVNNGELAKFINEVEVDRRLGVISGQSKSDYEVLAGIVQGLANISVTEVHGENPISATTSPIGTSKSGNTVTIYHKGSLTAQSGFTKLSTDTYGHVTAGTPVEIGDISGLTGFDTAVKAVETKLSTGTTGSGNVVKGISVSGHTITTQMGSISSGDVTDFVAGVQSSESQLSTASTENTGNAITNITVNGHVITIDKAKTFSENGHKHSGEDITGGTVGISYLPTATTVTSSDETHVPTSKAVQDAIDQATLDGVRYKGTTSGTPTTAKVGDEYMASGTFEIPADRSGSGSATTVEAGDYIIARTSGTTSKFDVKEKNLDGAVTSTGMTPDQIVLADGERIIKSVAPSDIKVGSAFTADSALTVELSGVQNADDLKAIEALTGTTGILRKTDANTWDLAEVVDTLAEFSGLTTTGSLVDAKVVKDAIVQNEEVTSAALNDLNDRINELSGGSASAVTELSGSVITLSASTVAIESGLNELSGTVESLTFTQYASAITINGTKHDVVNNGVDLGDYLSADTKVRINSTDVSLNNEGKFDLGSFLSASTAHITTIQQSSTASAVTTTINYKTSAGVASAATIVQDLVIDCGTY